MLPLLGNMPVSGNKIVREGLRELQRLLPPGWKAAAAARKVGPRKQLATSGDAVFEISAPDRRSTMLAVQAKTRPTPKDLWASLDEIRGAGAHGSMIFIARYLSEGARNLLREAKVNHLDLTGNIWILISEPGLYIERQGASEDPDREARSSRSLRGPKVGRIVRALIDRREPPGVRELAHLTKINAGYVSRVLAYLDSQALITRVGYGRMQSVDWPALLRSWAQASPLEARGEMKLYLEPRGLSSLLARLSSAHEQYAVTGGLAAAAFAPVTPARLGIIWTRDAAAAVAGLGLRAAEVGSNVLLGEPSDEVVFEGAVQRGGVWYAAMSQVAADLLTSPGRGPAEGEELISWMKENEGAWRQ